MTDRDLARHDDESPNAHVFQEAAERRAGAQPRVRRYCEIEAVDRFVGEGGPCIEREDVAGLKPSLNFFALTRY